MSSERNEVDNQIQSYQKNHFKHKYRNNSNLIRYGTNL